MESGNESDGTEGQHKQNTEIHKEKQVVQEGRQNHPKTRASIRAKEQGKL